MVCVPTQTDTLVERKLESVSISWHDSLGNTIDLKCMWLRIITYTHSPGAEHDPCTSWQPRLQIAIRTPNTKQNALCVNWKFVWQMIFKLRVYSNMWLQTFFTISAFPSTQANFVSAFAARKMAELIVTWPTKCRTRCVEIILRALNTNAKKEKKRINKEKKHRNNSMQSPMQSQKGHKITMGPSCGNNTNYTKIKLIYTLILEYFTYRYVIRAFLPI